MAPAPAAPLPHHPVRLSDPRRQPIAVASLPDAAGRAAVAAHLGVREVRRLRLDGRLVPEGREGWRIEARLGATVVQDCVVTLAPVVTRIEEPVLIRYLAGLAEPEGGEAEVPEEDVEPLPALLDLGGVMVEALSLALPPWPRAPGVALAEADEAPEEGGARPFAGLRDRLEGGG